jgi:hypothetical protein
MRESKRALHAFAKLSMGDFVTACSRMESSVDEGLAKPPERRFEAPDRSALRRSHVLTMRSRELLPFNSKLHHANHCNWLGETLEISTSFVLNAELRGV